MMALDVTSIIDIFAVLPLPSDCIHVLLLCLQVKILRETGKVGSDSDSKSKGLAFVEFTEHEHALCALRQLNNNPTPFGECRICHLDAGLVEQT